MVIFLASTNISCTIKVNDNIEHCFLEKSSERKKSLIKLDNYFQQKTEKGEPLKEILRLSNQEDEAKKIESEIIKIFQNDEIVLLRSPSVLYDLVGCFRQEINDPDFERHYGEFVSELSEIVNNNEITRKEVEKLIEHTSEADLNEFSFRISVQYLIFLIVFG